MMRRGRDLAEAAYRDMSGSSRGPHGEELEAVLSVASLLAQDGTLAENMTLALERILIVADADVATYRATDSTGHAVALWSVGNPDVARIIGASPDGAMRPKGIAYAAFKSGLPQVREAYTNGPRARAGLRNAGVSSVAAFPVRDKKRVIGVVIVASKHDSFGQRVVHTLTSIANYIGVLIEEARLLEAERLRADELAALVAVSKVLVSPDPEEQRIHTALQVLVDVSGADRALLRLAKDGEGLAMAGLVGTPAEYTQSVQSDPDAISNRAFRSRETVLQRGFRTRAVAGSVLALPMNTPSGTLGVAVLGSSDVDCFTPTTISLLESIVAFMGLVLSAQEMRKEIDFQQALAERRDTFIATASHELRTPMSSIVGLSEMLMDREPESREERQRWYGMIHRESTRLTEIVSDMLDVTRIQAGTLQLEIAEVSLKETVESAVAPLQNPEGPHRLIVEVPDDLPDVAADQMKLTQVLVNLVGNAIKYSPQGGEIMVRAAASQPGSVSVEIQDHGIGISQKDQRLLFQPFGRVRNATTAKIRGTGLGLYITKNFIEAMGGTLSIDSVPEEGSTFSFNLPLAA